MDNVNKNIPSDGENANFTDYAEGITECFGDIPDVAIPLLNNAERLLKKIKKCSVQHQHL